MKNKIVKIIEELNETYFKELLNNVDKTIYFEYLECSDVNKGMYIEKLYDYFDSYQIMHSLNDDEIAKCYVTTLNDFLTNNVVKKSRAELYLNKLKQIEKNIKKCDENALLDNLQDYTRTFTSLYFAQKTKSTKIDDINFKLSKEILSKSIDYLKEEKATKKIIDKKNKLDIKYSKVYFAIYLVKAIYLYMLMNEPKNDVVGG